MFLGNARNRLPYVYVGDVAAGCLLAATNAEAAGQAYNLASSETVTQRDLFAAVAEGSGLTLPKRSIPATVAHGIALAMELSSVLGGRRWRPPMSRFGITLVAADYIEDAGKAERELGWRARTPMREAVRRAVEWQRAQKRQPVAG